MTAGTEALAELELLFDQRVQAEVGREANIAEIAADVAELELGGAGEGAGVEILAAVAHLGTARESRGLAGGDGAEGADVEGVGVIRRADGDGEAGTVLVT